MSELVQLSKVGDVAVITINNPPVNALSPGVPEGIESAIAAIEKDPSVKAAVLIGGGRTFIAGADINMFVQITSGKGGRIHLLPTLLKIENCSKPVVVAIHGNALGDRTHADHWRGIGEGLGVSAERSERRGYCDCDKGLLHLESPEG